MIAVHVVNRVLQFIVVRDASLREVTCYTEVSGEIRNRDGRNCSCQGTGRIKREKVVDAIVGQAKFVRCSRREGMCLRDKRFVHLYLLAGVEAGEIDVSGRVHTAVEEVAYG